MDRDFIASLVAAPVGAVLLAQLESEQGRDGSGYWISPQDVDPTALRSAIESLSGRSAGDLLATAVNAARELAGPWSALAPMEVARALRHASKRVPLADALVDRLGHPLTAPLETSRQEWWWSVDALTAEAWMAPLGSFRRPCSAWVTATPDGLWTVTTPDEELADALINAWEHLPGLTTRWHLRVETGVRVFEIRGPGDWQALVTRYPLARPIRPNSSWEIPGGTFQGNVELEAIPGQRAMRSAMRRFVEPEWNAVAVDWDAVHLTWGGFLTTEGTVIDLEGGDVAMLRNWSSERTLWLNPVLSQPEALPPPIRGIDSGNGTSADPEYEKLLTKHRALLAQRLGLDGDQSLERHR